MASELFFAMHLIYFLYFLKEYSGTFVTTSGLPLQQQKQKCNNEFTATAIMNFTF